MLEGVRYLKLEGNENLINNFYDILFNWRGNRVIETLKGYCNLNGNAVNKEMRCFFANEFSKNDEEYFGEEGIAFYFDNPAVPEDCIVILTYEEFYDVVKTRFENYVRNNQENQDEIWLLIKNLKRAIKIMHR